MAFQPDEISTQLCLTSSIDISHFDINKLVVPSTQANFQDLNTPVPWSVISQQPDCFMYRYVSHDSSQFNYNYTMRPNLKFPTAVTKIDPAGATYPPLTFGAEDPPYVLQKVTLASVVP